MATHAPTGPGRISVNKNVPMGGIRAVMSNFDIDVDVPKPEHIYFLDSRVVPLISGRTARVWLQGSASSTGTDAHNLALSRRRAENVARHLESRGIQSRQLQIDAVGEGLASTHPAENADDRAVAILAAPLFEPPPPPKPHMPQPEAMPTATSFRLRLIGGIGAGARVIAIDRLYFQIWDPTHKVSGIYEYTGGGIGASVRSISATMKGPWNEFRTTGPVAVDEFAGAARFTTGGAGSYTLNYLNMMQMPRGTATLPNPLSISTGFTVGVGASTTVGGMALMTAGPFTGP
jgi:hypothetical protein